MPNSMKLYLIVLITILANFTAIKAQDMTSKQVQSIKAIISYQHQQEQKAFLEGDCDKVLSFFDQNVQFYAAGRKAPSWEFIGKFCQQIPRPFPETGEIKDEIHVTSPTTAYLVRTIDLAENPDSKEFKKEVITKIWQETPDGWKIVHFHSSVNTIKTDR